MIQQHNPYPTPPRSPSPCCVCEHHPEIPSTLESLDQMISGIWERLRFIDRSQHAFHLRLEGVAVTSEEQNKTFEDQFEEINRRIEQIPKPSAPDHTEELEGLRKELAESKKIIQDLKINNEQQDKRILSLEATNKALVNQISQLFHRMTLLEEKTGRNNNHWEAVHAKRGSEHADLVNALARLASQTEQNRVDQNTQVNSLQQAVQQLGKLLKPTEPAQPAHRAKTKPTPNDGDDKLLSEFKAAQPPAKTKSKPTEKKENTAIATLHALTQFLNNPDQSDFTLETRDLLTEQLCKEHSKTITAAFLQARQEGLLTEFFGRARQNGFELVLAHKTRHEVYVIPAPTP